MKKVKKSPRPTVVDAPLKKVGALEKRLQEARKAHLDGELKTINPENIWESLSSCP